MNNCNRGIRRRGLGQRGFTLIEALVALVVTAFGMFAIASFQITMSRSSEVAKQRSEAVRLAQLKLEELRSFETVVSDGVGGKYDFVSDVVGSAAAEVISPTSGSFTTNTAYTRSWTVTRNDGVTTAAGTDAEKWINMLVTWADRTGQQHEVRLRSIISRSDPVDLGTLFTGPGATKTRTPKNRNINIPYPAVQLGGGKSAFQPPGSSNSYVFDDVTGEVLGYCTGPLTAGATVDVASTAGCTAQKAYLLSGYIHFLSSLPGGTEKNVDEGVTNPNETTRDLTVGIDFLTSPPGAPSCFAERQKVVRFGNIADPRQIQSASRSGGTTTIQTNGNHGFSVGDFVSINGVTGGAFDGVFQIVSKTNGSFTFADSRANGSSTGGLVTVVQELTLPETTTPPSAYNTVIARFVAYTCIVRPSDEDVNASTPDTWSGQFKLQASVAVQSATRVIDLSVTDTVTIDTSTAHGFVTGQTVSITGVPDFNGTFTITKVDDDTFTYGFDGLLPAGVIGAASLATPGSGSAWTLGATADAVVGASNTKNVCRFTGDYKTDNVMSNSEHPLTYRRVSGALDNQNYLVVPYTLTCPTDTEPAPVTSDDYLNTNTVLHQTTILGGRPFGGSLSQGTQWGASSTSGEQGTEILFPMF
jgi:prepilin-type N-terminal cleavage/methylation domain-containing protein